MTGIVVVTHARLGHALIEAAQFILGEKIESVAAVSIDINDHPKKARKKIVTAINGVSQQGSVMIMTDMFGGTSSNMSYSFLEEGRMEVISGVNLPMLIKAITSREEMDITDLAADLEAYGRKSISLASSILKGNKRSK
jgi:PTS system mannose-specific IIA component